jgi:uncharacterized protein (DUF1919 family)
MSELNNAKIPLINSIILSNTCVGCSVIKAYNILPYNNPFIGTLIPNDNDYVKLINNLSYYLGIEPKLGDPSENSVFAIQSKSKWYMNKDIPVPYPVIYIDDIEIHCIHDIDLITTLDKFKRRFNRMKEIINLENYRIISLLSSSETMNEHPNPAEFIDNYFKDPKDLIVQKYFMGLPRHNIYDNINIYYIVIPEWENESAQRNSSYGYKFNDQEFNKQMFIKYLDLYAFRNL